MDPQDELIVSMLEKAFATWMANPVRAEGDDVLDNDFGFHMRAAMALVLFRAHRREDAAAAQ